MSRRPSVRAAGSGRVPAPASSFVGRESDIDALQQTIENARLVTLTGPGGSGKTRLAIEWAHAHSDQGFGPIRFVDLAPIRDGALVPSAIANALDVEERGATIIETITNAIGDQPLVLILDNLEHLSGVGAVVGRLLEGCPNLRILGTSRRSLHVRGEQEFPAQPLRLPTKVQERSPDQLQNNPAVELFVDRARAVNRRFRVTRANAASIAELCRRLDGLPLALELAAARIRILTPASLLARLDERLPIATRGPVDAPARHQTLAGAIAWSADLLEPEERDVFAGLSVFLGGFTLEAALAIVGAGRPDDLMPRLERLVDNSLIVERSVDDDEEPRFGMLETIREYAWAQLPDDRGSELQDRHLAWFVAQVEDASRRSRGAGERVITRLVADQANVRAALTHAAASNPESLVRLVAALGRRFWHAIGGRQEGMTWFEQAYRFGQVAPSDVYLTMLQQGAWMFNHWGDRDRAARLFTELGAAAHQANDDEREFEAGIGLAYLALDRGDFDQAEAAMSAMLALARKAGLGGSSAEALTGLGFIARMRGDTEAARVHFSAAVSTARTSGDAWATAWSLAQLGDLHRSAGRVALAEAALREALEHAAAAGDEEIQAWAAIGLVRTATLRGQLDVARGALETVADTIRRNGHPLDEPFLFDAAAEWFAAIGVVSDAVETAAAAERARSQRTWSQPPDDTKARERILRDARTQLGPVRFQAAWDAGEHRSAAEALAAVIDAVAAQTVRAGSARVAASHYRSFGLTRRELEILELVASGMTDGEIAESLVISKKTASVHVANVKSKLNAGSRVEVATMALSLGLVGTAPERLARPEGTHEK